MRITRKMKFYFATFTCAERWVTLAGVNEPHHTQGAPAQVAHPPVGAQTATHKYTAEICSTCRNQSFLNAIGHNGVF